MSGNCRAVFITANARANSRVLVQLSGAILIVSCPGSRPAIRTLPFPGRACTRSRGASRRSAIVACTGNAARMPENGEIAEWRTPLRRCGKSRLTKHVFAAGIAIRRVHRYYKKFVMVSDTARRRGLCDRQLSNTSLRLDRFATRTAVEYCSFRPEGSRSS